MRVTDGSIDLAAAATLSDDLERATSVLDARLISVLSVDLPYLLPPVSDAIERLERELARADADAAQQAAIGPRLRGGDLLLLQSVGACGNLFSDNPPGLPRHSRTMQWSWTYDNDSTASARPLGAFTAPWRSWAANIPDCLSPMESQQVRERAGLVDPVHQFAGPTGSRFERSCDPARDLDQPLHRRDPGCARHHADP